MKIRLVGTPAEVLAALAALHDLPTLDVAAVSTAYPCRHGHGGLDGQVRVYVEAYVITDGAR